MRKNRKCWATLKYNLNLTRIFYDSATFDIKEIYKSLIASEDKLKTVLLQR